MGCKPAWRARILHSKHAACLQCWPMGGARLLAGTEGARAKHRRITAWAQHVTAQPSAALTAPSAPQSWMPWSTTIHRLLFSENRNTLRARATPHG